MEDKSFITYDENWQSVSKSEYPKLSKPEPEEKTVNDNNEPKPKHSKQYLLTFQLVVCVLIALSAFILKSTGSELYGIVREWYYSQLDSSAIIDENGRLDLSALLNPSTPDEAQDR